MFCSNKCQNKFCYTWCKTCLRAFFPIRQLNLHHSIGATADLVKRTSVNSNFIYCLQEPYVVRNRLAYFPAGMRPLAGADRPRAAIWGSRGVNLWLVQEYSSVDICTVLWRPPGRGTPDIMVASLYLDITGTGEDFFPKEFVALVRHCQGNNIPLLVCMDSNAHSTLWGKDNNKRGEQLEEFMFGNGLRLENVGTRPTFQARGTETTIDITLTLNLDLVRDWRVSDVATLSDHMQIEFELELSGREQPKVVRNLRKADWGIFREEMTQQAASRKPLPIRWTRSRLDEEAGLLNNDISKALKRSCPRLRVRKDHKRSVEWTEEAAKARRIAKAKLRLAKRTKKDEDWTAYITAKLNFRSAFRRSRDKNWKTFSSDVTDVKTVARLHKIAQGEENRTLGLLTKDDGRPTTGPSDTLGLLFDVHFPGSAPATGPTKGQLVGSVTVEDFDKEEVTFITAQKVKAAMASFGSWKAAGPDEIKPVVLQNLGADTVDRIVCMFKACLLLNYTPTFWRTSKVVFIPKQGKDDYRKAKSFRPISLTSFLFKTLERVVLWELEATTLRGNPLSRNQHAFRRGSSTESALSDMVDQIERSILRGEHAMGVFLDIQGAFDNLPTDVAVRGMRDHNLPPVIINWYAHYLDNRFAEAEVKGESAGRALTRGTPQGGVLSPLVWNLSFDSLLNLFQGSVSIKGFADDAALLICGFDLPVMQQLMQQAINMAVDWGRDNGLTFGAAKTVAVLFSRARKLKLPTKLKVMDTEIPYSESAKYLGIVLDRKLNFQLHIDEKVKRAKYQLLKFRQAIGKLWGPLPYLTRWTYTGIVRPMVLYGALVWGQHAERRVLPLSRLQRLAAGALTHVRQSAPTAGLEIICHLMPLDLLAQREGAMAALRVKSRNPTRWDGLALDSRGRPNGKYGHLRWAENVLDDAGATGLQLDSVAHRHNWDKLYAVDKETFGWGNLTEAPDLTVATDGSKIGDDIGWGFQIRRGGSVIASDRGRLGKWATVFQSEITAIDKACDTLLELEGTSAFFFVDSQAALLALDKNYVTQNLVSSCIAKLNRLGGKMSVHLRWVKAHVGHDINEAADSLAKEGGRLNLIPAPIPVSRAVFKQLLGAHVEKLWDLRWRTYFGAKETKIWFPHPNKKSALALIRESDRGLLCKVIQAVTGHCYLNYHHNVRVAKLPMEEAKCRFCGYIKETPFHVIASCDAFWRQRQDAFLQVSLSECPDWKPKQLLRFLAEPSMEWAWKLRGAEQRL